MKLVARPFVAYALRRIESLGTVKSRHVRGQPARLASQVECRRLVIVLVTCAPVGASSAALVR